MKSIAACFAGLLITLVVSAAAQLSFGYFLVGLELLLTGGAWLDGWYLRRSLRCRVSVPREHSFRSQSFPLEVELENRCLLPMAELSVELLCRDRFTGTVSGLSGTASLDSRETARLRFSLEGAHCGALEVSLRRVTVADHLGLVKMDCPVEEEWSRLFLLPRNAEETRPETAFAPSQTQEESEDSRLKQAEMGTDHDLRPFRPGDGLKKIHWKAAAKTDELIVRDFEAPEEQQRLLVLEPVPKEDEEVDRDRWDRYLERLDALSSGLLKGCGRYEVAWVETNQGALRRFPVENEDGRLWMLCAVMSVPDRNGLGFGDWNETLFDNKSEEKLLRLRWSDVA